MKRPRVVSRAEWLVARKELLAKGKATTRARDAPRPYAKAWVRHHDKYPVSPENIAHQTSEVLA